MMDRGRYQLGGEAGLSPPQVGMHRICPHFPQALLLLRFHINIYKLLESIKSILYNSKIIQSVPYTNLGRLPWI